MLGRRDPFMTLMTVVRSLPIRRAISEEESPLLATQCLILSPKSVAIAGHDGALSSECQPGAWAPCPHPTEIGCPAMVKDAPRIGSRHEIDDTWKIRMQQELDRRGWSQRKLARELGIDQKTVNLMLKLKTAGGRIQETSPHALDAAKLLGVPLPLQAHTDPALNFDNLRELQALDPEAHRDAMALANRLLDAARARKRTK